MDLQDIIKTIGRGKQHARALDQATARELYQAILSDKVDQLSLGAILLALRMKGEADTEMSGFFHAVQSLLPQWHRMNDRPLPIVIPSYNGARRQANLTPLLAILLHRCGIPVMVHCIKNEPTRVTSLTIFQALKINISQSADQAWRSLNNGEMAVITIDDFCPPLAKQLNLRWQLGIRNSAHSLVKLLSPFAAGAALHLTSISHPEYKAKVINLLTGHDIQALLLQGCEGEVYANPQRLPEIIDISCSTNILTKKQTFAESHLPKSSMESDTVQWTEQVLTKKIPVPQALRIQIACCLMRCKALSSVEQGLTWLSSQGY